ncbi:MAG: septum site-determining protein MinC [Gammaproteobacteria bacterium]|nr:MAG: septum site-determining protein MinC [Gammaproteobacteria bacterium]
MSDKAAFREIAIKFGIGALPSLQPTSRPVSQKRSTAAEAVANEAAKIPVTTKTSHRAPMSAIAGDKAEDHNQTATPANTDEAHQAGEEPRKTFDDSSTGSTKAAPNNQIIRHPVRSGQRIYAHGDLTVIGTVSPGAEVIADGNIHVYGKLGGRAIAGAQGNETAAIFCQQLDAELVSIAGNYKQLDDIDSAYRGQRVQILLENEKICFFSL